MSQLSFPVQPAEPAGMNTPIRAVQQVDDVTVAVVCGEIDASNTTELQRRLADLQREHLRLVVDCSEIRFFAARGLRIMVELQEFARNDGTQVVFVLPEQQRRIARRLGLSQLRIADSLDGAQAEVTTTRLCSET